MSEETIDNMEKTSTEKKNTESYRSIFKATSLFGGVEVYNILIRVIRSKIVAVLLGPMGIGIQGLYHSAISMIQYISSLGLAQSAVKDIAAARGSGDDKRISETATTIRRLVWATGLLGMFIVILCSPILSLTSFNDNKHVLAFVLLSVILLLDQLSAGQKVILRGMRRIKDMAKASTIGVTIGLITTVPLYYIWGIDGIVPALIINSLSGLFVSWYFSRKVKIFPVKISYKETLLRGGEMMRMGLALCYSSILVSVCAYAVRIFISSVDGPEMVGLYTAGVTITSSYVGMIFSAMNADFYPRLAAVNKDNYECRRIINEQGEIGALIMGPLVLLCVVFMPFVIELLYSDAFLSSCNYVILAIIGMLFRLGSWLISIQFIAKGEAKQFAINETASNIYFLVLNVLGYKFYGLVGIGASFILSYIIYLIQVYAIANKKYRFSYTFRFGIIYLVQIIFSVLGLLTTLLLEGITRYMVGSFFCVFVISYSFIELNKRIRITELIKKRVNGKK